MDKEEKQKSHFSFCFFSNNGSTVEWLPCMVDDIKSMTNDNGIHMGWTTQQSCLDRTDQGVWYCIYIQKTPRLAGLAGTETAKPKKVQSPTNNNNNNNDLVWQTMSQQTKQNKVCLFW
jgi:hypothetical protein